jgi:hypothetical protein
VGAARCISPGIAPVAFVEEGILLGTRLFYVDKYTSYNINAEVFDAKQRYWKGLFFQFSPVSIPGTEDHSFGDNLHGAVFDFQKSHATGVLLYHSEINQNAGKYQDIARYATPGGLQQINQ